MASMPSVMTDICVRARMFSGERFSSPSSALELEVARVVEELEVARVVEELEMSG